MSDSKLPGPTDASVGCIVGFFLGLVVWAFLLGVPVLIWWVMS